MPDFEVLNNDIVNIDISDDEIKYYNRLNFLVPNQAMILLDSVSCYLKNSKDFYQLLNYKNLFLNNNSLEDINEIFINIKDIEEESVSKEYREFFIYGGHKENTEEYLPANLFFEDNEQTNLLDFSQDRVSRCIIKNNVLGFYLFDYISTYNLDKVVEYPVFQRIREFVFAFKDGKLSHLKLISITKTLLKNYNSNIIDSLDYCLCVIPASSSKKNKERFETFCSKLSNELGIINGYNFIQRKTDRVASHMQKEQEINVLVGVYFDKNRLKNKHVILFDDVITKGNSMVKFTEYLINECECKSVINIFLGKTFYSGEDVINSDFANHNERFFALLK